ncbi:hydrogenase nickel incorporation protein HypB [Streptomyces sp. KK5PA1]|uniref:Hydrogenase nickel incorporation protein HypB n=1 Tax=Actinacidiphila acididurans TaxID=2784346 RepID=A0ABS2U3R6_9ACTN|nr:hydrogenase nickel incorporation protein HypB [Actinacidiphila acididurans]
MCRSVAVRQAVLAKNDGLAAGLRARLAERGVTAVNLLSSPGSGKTALLELVLRRALERGTAAAALTADLATENDATRLARSGAPVKQVLTGGLCHLEAAQLGALLDGWLPDRTRLLFVENVGNLVCPASYDLGETLRIALMSVTEGEDKPLKYPTAFGTAHLVVLTKTDLAAAAGFDEAAFTAAVQQVNPGVEVVRTSARTTLGADTLLDRVLSIAAGAAPHRPLLAADHLSRHGHDHGPDGEHVFAPAHEGTDGIAEVFGGRDRHEGGHGHGHGHPGYGDGTGHGDHVGHEHGFVPDGPADVSGRPDRHEHGHDHPGQGGHEYGFVPDGPADAFGRPDRHEHGHDHPGQGGHEHGYVPDGPGHARVALAHHDTTGPGGHAPGSADGGPYGHGRHRPGGEPGFGAGDAAAHGPGPASV